MKKYSSVAKSIIGILNVIFVTILGVSLIMSMGILKLTGNNWGTLSKGVKYNESETLKNTLNGQAGYLEDYFNEQMFFETNGTYDASKKVDIFKYDMVMNGITNIYEPLEYRLGDLLGVYNIIHNDSYSKLNNSMYNSSEREEINAMEQNEIADNYSAELIDEIDKLIRPTSTTSLSEYISQGEYDAQDCYQLLLMVINDLQDDIYDYQTSKSIYDRKNTNLRYLGVNLQTKVRYTNLRTTKEALDQENVVTIEKGDYQIQISVDETYPIKDKFYYNAKSYDRYTPYFWMLLWCVALGMVGALFTYGGLFVITWRTDERGIILEFIDKIKTELAIIVWLLMGVGFVMFAFYNAEMYWDDFEVLRLIMSGAGVFVAAIIWLSAYLSILRRIKTQTIFSNSVLAAIKTMFTETFSHTKISARVMLFFMGYIGINVYLFGVDEYGILLVAIFNVIVGILVLRDGIARQKVQGGIEILAKGELDYKIDESELRGSNLDLAKSINSLGEGLQDAVEKSMKNERLKTDLITNVSHDIKTPLTSIINYVDLLKREKIDNEKVQSYIKVLDSKSQRLKQLTEDLVEASKISSGNITLELINMDFNELLQQTVGEFEEKFKEKNLYLVIKNPDTPVVIEADGRRVWRIVENLFNNIFKYALPGTRVYIDLITIEDKMLFSVKNISQHPLNIQAEELTQRFIRGDVSRSTEGSGLGLSIAKNLTDLQKGNFDIYLDGDLFKVTIKFNLSK